MRVWQVKLGMQLMVLGVACLGTTGCFLHRHVKVAPLPVPPKTTVPLAPTPEPSTPPQVASVPVAPQPLPTQPVQPKARKTKPKFVPPPPPPPVVVASAAPVPDASVIGSLSAGDDSSPAQQQKAQEAIAAVERRLVALPADTQKKQEDGVTRVRDFLQKAREALRTGDAEGAMTLATKAKVLLDDLLK